MASLELYRRSISGSAMAALRVVEHLDVVEDIGSRVIAGRIDLAADAFALEQLEEALGHSVVVAVATPAHAADQVMVAQESLPLVASELGGFNRSLQHL